MPGVEVICRRDYLVVLLMVVLHGRVREHLWMIWRRSILDDVVRLPRAHWVRRRVCHVHDHLTMRGHECLRGLVL